MNRLSELFPGRVALAVVSALVIGGLSVGIVLVTAPAPSPASASSSAATTSSNTTNTSTGTTNSSGSTSSDDGEQEGENGRGLSGVVQQVDSGTGNFVLQDRRGATWTIVVTPNTQFVGVSPSQIQPGQRLWVQGTVQSNNTVLAASVLASRDD